VVRATDSLRGLIEQTLRVKTLMGLCFLKTLLLPEAPGLEEALKSFRSFSEQIYKMLCEISKHPYKVNLRSSKVHKNFKV
jgi:hypothetical protein